MAINPEAVGVEATGGETGWDSTDCLLYALGVGAGTIDPVNEELEFTTENSDGITQRALPTMAVVLGGGLEDGGPLAKIGAFNPALLVHGEHRVELHQPVPVEATVATTARIDGIYDKGKAALVVSRSTSTDVVSGEPLFTNTANLFIRGEGGWGGERGPSGPRNVAPERDPDHIVSYATRTDQALLYRLNGDRNPLHSDKNFSAMGGFDKPILHGLCTYGFTGRALLHSVCGGDPDRFGAMEGRFTSPVMPGETLQTKMWTDGDGAIFQTWAGDRIVIDAGRLELR